MILHYFKKKENKERDIAKNLYKSILEKTANFINIKDVFVAKDYNSSFEILSILLFLHIKIILEKKYKNSKVINDHLIECFILDLDESLRVKGIGDMSIGKYVKSYVKKFYFRLSKLKELDCYNSLNFREYLNFFDFIKDDKLVLVSEKLEEFYVFSKKSFNIQDYIN